MNEVSCRVCDIYLRLLAETKTPLERLLEGLDVTPELIRDPHGRLSWDDFSRITDRMELILGGPEAFEAAGARFLEAPPMESTMFLISLVASPRLIYWAGPRWAAPALFSVPETRFEVTGPTSVWVSVTIPEPHRMSEAFFRFTAGAFRAAPRIFHQPDSRVESVIRGRTCEFRVLHPPSRTVWTRLLDAPRTLFATRRAFEALRAQNEDLRRSLEALAEARRTAEDASQLRSQFLAKVTHEFRTPLSGVLGMSEALLDANLSPTEREQARAIHDSARSLLRVVNDILDFSKLQSGGVAVHHEDTDLERLTSQVIRVVANTRRSSRVHLASQLEPGVPRFVRVDAGRLRQVLLNLVENAARFTEAGSVLLRARTATNARGTPMLRFEVEDTGLGIPEPWCQQIFAPFVQVDGTLRRRFGGTGLGLSISKQLVELMGGEIGVQSTPDVGSLFWFTVPLVAASKSAMEGVTADLPASESPSMPEPLPKLEPREPPALSVVLPPDGPERSRHLLVVEDNVVNQRMLVRLLERSGHRVDTALNGREAIAAVAHSSYDAIFMDLQMPEMDGFEATSIIRTRERGARRTPIVAISAHTEQEYVVRARHAGMDAHLAKPVEKRVLFDTLHAVLVE